MLSLLSGLEIGVFGLFSDAKGTLHKNVLNFRGVKAVGVLSVFLMFCFASAKPPMSKSFVNGLFLDYSLEQITCPKDAFDAVVEEYGTSDVNVRCTSSGDSFSVSDMERRGGKISWSYGEDTMVGTISFRDDSKVFIGFGADDHTGTTIFVSISSRPSSLPF